MTAALDASPGGSSRHFDQTVLYRAIVDSATDYAIIAADLDGRVIEWNVGAEAALGWPAAEILGQPIAVIFTPEDRAAGVPENEMQRALQTGHAMDMRWHMRRDGSRFWADGRMMTLVDESGVSLGYLKIVRDETDRKLSTTQAMSATALRLITDHVETAIVQIDLAGAMVFANPAASRLFGWPIEDLVGRAFGDLLSPGGSGAAASLSPSPHDSFVDRDLVVLNRDGETLFVTSSQSPIMTEGVQTGAVLTLQDMGKRRQAEEAMRAEVRRHQGLARIQRAMDGAGADHEAIYRAAVYGAAEIMPQVDAASIELIDGAHTVNHLTSNPAIGEVGMRVPLSGSLTGAALALGLAVVCRDTEQDDRVDRARARRYGVRGMIVVPIARADAIVGVLKLSARRPDAFAPRDLLIAQILVGHIATAFARMDEAMALERLQRSEERLQLALQASETIGIWDWNVRANRCFGDPRFARLLGVDPAAAGEGLPIEAYTGRVQAEDLVWIKIAARRAMAEAGEFAMEFRVSGADAPHRWLFARGRAFSGADGHPARFIGAVVDITERKRIETSLRTAETNARLAVEAAGLGLWDYDLTADHMTMDDRTRDIVGLPAGVQPTLDVVMSFVHRRSADALRAKVQAALATATLADRAHEFEIVRQSDGLDRWVEVSAQAFFTDGRCTRIIGTIADITGRKHLEAALREDEQRFRTMAESIPQLAWMADPSGAIVWFNERWDDYVGRAADGSRIGLFAVTHEDQAGAVAERLARAFHDGTAWEDKLLLRGADGHDRWFLSRALPLRRADGSILRWFGTHTDIDDEVRAREAQIRFGEELERQVTTRTEELSRANERLVAEMADRQRVEEALRQSQKMEAVGQLTGGIAHDFNNLLTGITGSLDLMRKRIAQGRTADVERYMSAASASANRAAALTHRLLAFARRQPLDAKPVDLNALARSMEDLFRRTLGESIDILLTLAPDLWTTLCDPHQLENALLNLVINARDAMPDGGRLTIATANSALTAADLRDLPERREGDYVTLTVSDTGAGMGPDVMARIFEPFFTTKPIGQGTGLGLSMIYGFARQSEGHIAVASEEGRGTTFTLYLPRFGGAEEAPAAPPEVVVAGIVDGETVLVVEDDPVVRGVVLDVLADLGYRTLEAHDGIAGLDLLQSSARVDLLVTDVGLPGLNGRQLAEMGRMRRPKLKVLFITGYAENAVFGRGPSDPSMQMITKPFAIETLAIRIREMIAAR